MQHLLPTDRSTLDTNVLVDAVGLARDTLSRLGRVPTAAEEHRLAKTLERLWPAANAALAGESVSKVEICTNTDSSSAEFASVLYELANA